ncbi:MAG TPA: hypothetical protein DEB06_01910 [Phycisphaerales bacterium]|nr:hypothetical protein [Phycisphaerales bacterium]
MPTFRYQTLNGTPRTGGFSEVEAPDRAGAIRQIVQRGQTPTAVEEVRTGGAIDAGALARRLGTPRTRRLSRAHTASLVRELATAIGAGLPLVQSLRALARAGATEARRSILEHLIIEVEQGRPLSEAMRAYGPPCTELIVSLVGAGEAAGRLGEVLRQTASLLDRDVRLRRSLLGAMLYPLIVLGAVAVAVIVVVTVIVPRVLGAVSGQLKSIPLPTRIVQGVAHFVGDWWPLLLLAALGVAALWRLARRRPAWRLRIDTGLLRLPVVGPALRDVAVARFTRTLGTLTGAGLPVLASLRVTRQTLGNRAMEDAVDRVCEQVAAGRTIAEPLERSGWFPPLMVQIVALGEQTGRLDEMLTQAADAFEEKTEQSIKVLTTVLPPALIILMACVVGFVVLSILLPLIEMQERIG